MIAIGSLSLNLKKVPNGLSPLRRLLFNQVGLTIGLLLVFFTVPYWGWGNYVIRRSLTSIPSNFYFYHLIVFLFIFILVSIPVFFMGRTMPLLFANLASSVKFAGVNVGKIYAWNTLGCCMGAFMMGYVFLLYLNADRVFEVGIVLACFTVMLSFFHLESRPKIRASAVVILGVVIAGVSWLPSWSQELLSAGLFRAPLVQSFRLEHPGLYLELS